jgi:hypothetical protein
MVAKRGESSRHVLGWAGLPKYVHHPELDYGGWRDFLPGIEPLLAQDARPSGADEGRLFRAMHYCAYRAWMARGKQCVVTARAADWIARRERIRDHLILVNLGLCYDMLRRNRFTNVDEDELFSEPSGRCAMRSRLTTRGVVTGSAPMPATRSTGVSSASRRWRPAARGS